MNQYAALSVEEQEELLSNYLIEHWSVSSVRSFIRNEKDFEREYIFKDRTDIRGLSAIIGRCYHKALMDWFQAYQQGEERLGFDPLMMIAHAELESIPANEYKVTEKVSIFEMQTKALKRLNFLLKNFLAEVDTYLNEIQEILFIEQRIYEFITLDGIDIPIPLKMIPDLVFVNKEGYLCIIDHKSKSKYTGKTEIHLSCSQQSVAYSAGVIEKLKRPEFEALNKKYPKLREGVKWFYYYENKFSANRDGKRQIQRIDIEMNESARVYEAVLFEGVWRMLQAVNNPDYVYLMNPDDNFADKGDLFDFWAKNRIEGIDAFPNLTDKQKKILNTRRQDIRRANLRTIPKSSIKAFKSQVGFVSFNNKDMADSTTEEKIEHRLKCFGVMSRVAHTVVGYSCDTYLLEVGPGAKLSSISGFKMDIANAIGVPDVRISKNLVPYESNSFLSIEVNKFERKALTIGAAEISNGDHIFPIGRDNFHNQINWDLDNQSTPHLLVSGASGSGKSVAIKTIIEAGIVKGLPVSILDPKYEFTEYEKREGVLVLNELQDIEAFMELMVSEMNEMYKSGRKQKQLIIFDEANDCLSRQSKERKIDQEVGTDRMGNPKVKRVTDQDFRTLEENTMIIAQKSRSAGIHLVLASQRFSAKVLNGDAKANFTARLCLTVASGIDSKVMLDEEGAEKLNGKGDALYRSPEMAAPVRIQTYFFN